MARNGELHGAGGEFPYRNTRCPYRSEDGTPRFSNGERGLLVSAEEERLERDDVRCVLSHSISYFFLYACETHFRRALFWRDAVAPHERRLVRITLKNRETKSIEAGVNT